MSKYQNTFKRHEIKYLISREKYQQLREALVDQLNMDEYGEVTVCNIYFDTPDYRLIRTSLDKPVYKEKLRLRSYNIPTEEATVFVEIKKKFNGIVYKRREKMSRSQAEGYLYDSDPPPKKSQIMNEINWFLQFYKNLEPKMFISYDRIAMYGLEDSQLRVTFDSNIQWREDDLLLGKGAWGNPILGENQILMEIKIPGAMPLWLSRILTELEIYPTTFSKYGRAYLQAKLTNKSEQTKGEKKYA